MLELLWFLLFNADDFFILSFGLQAAHQFAALMLHDAEKLKPTNRDRKYWIRNGLKPPAAGEAAPVLYGRW